MIALAVHEMLDAAIVILIVLGSAALGFFQEFNASIAVSKLRQRLALSVTVLRDGVRRSLPVVNLVPGDIVELAAGNLVPADGRILAARDFLVTEAALTGESFPVEKSPGVVPADAPLAARTNCVFLGTSVRSGTATVLIAETGKATALGAIASRLGKRRPGDRVRPRRAPVRLSAHAGDDRHRARRARRQCDVRQAACRLAAVCRGARGRAVAGAACRRSSA